MMFEVINKNDGLIYTVVDVMTNENGIFFLIFLPQNGWSYVLAEGYIPKVGGNQ